MEWIQDLLKLLFGQLGVVGTVCFAATVHIAWLFHQEKEDHKNTRETIKDVVASQALANMKFIELLTEIKTYMRIQKELAHGTNGRREEAK